MILTPQLIEIIYNSASMERWNDYPRMLSLTELDKQAHKFIIAYFLSSYESDINRLHLIEAGIFEFFRRVIVTDIRPDVFREMVKKKGKELNSFVLEKLKDKISYIDDGDFYNRMKRYFEDQNIYKKERFLLEASHYLATKWEFQIVYQSSKFLHDIEDLKKAVDNDIHKYKHLKGVTEIALDSSIAKLIDLNGRLRFQIRWAQTPRVPKTSVLGHMLIVAIFSYFYSISVNACEERVVFNFFTSIFHDLPEALTRDIISPIKRSVKGLEELILDFEIEKINNDILPLVPKNILEEFSYILGIFDYGDKIKKDEFKSRIKKEGMVIPVNNISDFNENILYPIDGDILKGFDDLAAFTEAALSLGYGIKSIELKEALEKLKEKYRNKKFTNFDVYNLMNEVEKYFITRGK